MKKMNLKHKLFYTFFNVLVFLSIQSCIKEEQDLNKMAASEWNPSIAIPLVNSSLGISKLLIQGNSSLIKADKDGFLMLTYKPQPFTTPGNELIQLPDQVFNKVLATGASFMNLPKDTIIKTEYNDEFSYNTFNEVKIDSIDIKSGYLSFFIKSSFKHSINLKITLPTFKKNGKSLTAEIPLNFTNAPLIVINKKIDLTDYVATMSENGKIPVSYSTDINFVKANPINSTDKIEIMQTLGDFNFKGLYGYFGQIVQSMPLNTISLGIFDNSIPGMGKFSLANPKIKINIENTMGIPIKGEIKTLETTDMEGKTVISLLPFTGKDFTNPFTIPSPLSSNSEPGKLTLTIDNDNTPNLSKLLSSAPRNFAYAADITLNPTGSGKNFITDKSKITISPELELPLEGTAYGFSISDTFNFPTFQDSIIESLLIRANITNSFPLNVRIQATFLDDAYNKLDSLFSPLKEEDKIEDKYKSLILSGKINADGKVTAPTNKITDVVYSKSRAANLKKAKFVIIKGELETTKEGENYRSVKFFDSYKLDVKIGAQIQGKIKF